MIGSKLADYIYPANSFNNSRFGNVIKSITIHHMAGILTAKQCVDYWNNNNRETSSHYGIGKDGKIGQYVSENHTAWTNGNQLSNRTSVTIETSNSTMAPSWLVSDLVLEKLILLIYDIAVRNNLLPLIKGQNLIWHSMVSNVYTECPGPYLTSKIDYIIERVNSMNEPFKIGSIVYNIEDIILYGTAGYDTLLQYVLPKNSESKVFKYHSVNGLYVAIKNMNDEFYPATWTKEFNKFTLEKPIMCNCTELKARIQYLEANPIIKEVIVEKPIEIIKEVIKEVPYEVIKEVEIIKEVEKDYTIGELIIKLVNKILKKE